MSDFQEVAQTYHRIKLLSTLSQYGKLFKVAYEMGEPIFTEEIPTAAVRIIYNNHKPITQYLFNPIFYNGLTDEERSFIIAHEALHLFFDHLSLIKEHQLNPKIANVAMDIVINETLIQGYGFNPNMEVLKQGHLSTIYLMKTKSNNIISTSLLALWFSTNYWHINAIQDNLTPTAYPS